MPSRSTHKIGADYIFTNVGPPLRSHVIVLQSDGKILTIDPAKAHDHSSVDWHKGALLPGYINAHCHLELSHMKGKVATGTGLVDFIRQVVSQRAAAREEIEDAIIAADQEMRQEGIVAVGDICNMAETFACKDDSSIVYYSFVEMFDFMRPALATQTYESYKKVYDKITEHSGHLRRAVPHAPYSVSRDMFAHINKLNSIPGSVSVHNQETQAEIDLFLRKDGGLVDLFADFGHPYEDFIATGRSPIHYLLEQLDPRHRHLLVHNTLTDSGDIAAAHAWSEQVYWVSCPNANLYIENRLPNYALFQDAGAKVCLGTDSLTSNWQLSIFEEMKSIKRYQSYVATEDLIRWATLHGAQALGLEDRFGILAPGRKPGINLVTLNDSGEIDDDSKSQKLV